MSVAFEETQGRSPIERVLHPFQQFAHTAASSGIVLLACAVVAVIWANSPWAASYDALWQTRLSVGAGTLVIDKPLLLWINDGLMAIFFFVVGLEIKREVIAGELSNPKKAALPIAAALGGILVPAAIYVAINAGTDATRGWGIPMATDIAFALGVLALLGSRVPISLKIFLTALAIVDDLAAVLVIAIFYTEQIGLVTLAFGAVGIGLLVAANLAGVRGPLLYGLVGAFVWVAFLKSGVHATIAGVLLAMTIPARRRIDASEFLEGSRALLDEFEAATREPGTADDRQAAVHALEEACERVQTPLHRLEHGLHPWVAFAIMPIFALANAGVALEGGMGEALTSPVTLGVILGLVVGKQVGVTLFAWLAVRLGLASLPDGVDWMHIYGVAWLAGIGFTMSLFITGLAFTDTALVASAKIGILTASVLAGAVGWAILRARRVDV